MFKVWVVLVALFLSCNVFSDCTANACAGVGKDVLLSVYPNAAGNIYLQAGEGRENLDCDLVDGHYMTLRHGHAAFKEAYSTILTALSTQKRLTVRIKNGSSMCEVSYVRMYL